MLRERLMGGHGQELKRKGREAPLCDLLAKRPVERHVIQRKDDLVLTDRTSGGQKQATTGTKQNAKKTGKGGEERVQKREQKGKVKEGGRQVRRIKRPNHTEKSWWGGGGRSQKNAEAPQSGGKRHTLQIKERGTKKEKKEGSREASKKK